MRIFVDTEFNGFGGQLMSMALVADDGREWYEVLPLPDVIEPWVAANVVPILGKEPIAEDRFLRSLHAFLRQYHQPVIVADWYTDLVHFFNSMRGRDHSESIHFPCSAALIDLNEYASEIPHNALSDARAIRVAVDRKAA